jgi:hypothetical protein
MNRDFEFKQLLRAYRSGIISEPTFEEEMRKLEGNGAGANGNGSGGFHAFGKTYKTERAAIISFLDKVRAGEANGGEAFAAWGSICKTECIRTGIKMIAEREAYHARIFEQRLLELGGEKRATTTEEGRKFKEYFGNPDIADTEKLLRFTKSVGDPKEAIKPICEFAALIKEDIETKEALRLFSEDELSSTTWVWESCAALNKPAEAEVTEQPAAQM